MELQWPLMLFTTLLCASAGLFAAQGVYAVLGRGAKAQMSSLITSFVLMVISGIAVFLHLQHWERIFNGFGHITSGITQELIAIVILCIMMVIVFVSIRRNDVVPKWVGIVSVIVCAGLVVVCGMSYMMPARPAWNNALQILSLAGLAFAAGAGLFALLDASEEDGVLHGTYTLVATAVNAVFSCAFLASMASAVGSFTDVGYYFDPNHPTVAVENAASYSPFSSGSMGFSIAVIALVLIAVAFAFYGKKSKNWKVAGAGVALSAVIGGLLLRVVFMYAGGSVFLFY